MAYYEDDPERAQAKADGVALILQGVPHRTAAQVTGIPPTTLRRTIEKLEAGTAQDDDLKRADQALMAQTYKLAQQAQQHTLRQLEAGALDDKNVIQAANVTLKALSAFRRWQKPEEAPADQSASTRILDRLEKALSDGAELQLTVSAPKPDRNAIDVEPVE